MGNFTSGHQAAHRRLSFLDLLGSQISGSLIPLSRWNHVGNLSLSVPHTRHVDANDTRWFLRLNSANVIIEFGL